MIKAIVFALVASSHGTSYGFKESDVLFNTTEECFSHYSQYEDWVVVQRTNNLYSSRGTIQMYETPIGIIFVNCQSI